MSQGKRGSQPTGEPSPPARTNTRKLRSLTDPAEISDYLINGSITEVLAVIANPAVSLDQLILVRPMMQESGRIDIALANRIVDDPGAHDYRWFAFAAILGGVNAASSPSFPLVEEALAIMVACAPDNVEDRMPGFNRCYRLRHAMQDTDTFLPRVLTGHSRKVYKSTLELLFTRLPESNYKTYKVMMTDERLPLAARAERAAGMKSKRVRTAFMKSLTMTQVTDLSVTGSPLVQALVSEYVIKSALSAKR